MHLMASLSFVKNCLLYLSLLEENNYLFLEDAIFEGNPYSISSQSIGQAPAVDMWAPPGIAGAQPTSMGGPPLSASPSPCDAA